MRVCIWVLAFLGKEVLINLWRGYLLLIVRNGAAYTKSFFKILKVSAKTHYIPEFFQPDLVNNPLSNCGQFSIIQLLT